MSAIPLPPAPGATNHVSLKLINSTVTLPGNHVFDELNSPENATSWLIQHELAPRNTTLLAYCQGQMTGMRENLRAIFKAHVTGEEPTPSALDSINLALGRVPTAQLLRFIPGEGFQRFREDPVTQLVEHALAEIAEDAAGLLSGPQAHLLTQCGSKPCDRFLIRTHARRHWCSTRCGDRVRAARAYAKQQQKS